ncbi:MAG: DUF2157 domain-containing protein [Thermoanaerobaculia bacterium]
MNTLDREIESLRPILASATDPLLRRERREVFSIYPELRVIAWAGAVLIATAIGIVIKRHYDVIGPVAVAALVGILALVCYAWAWDHRHRSSLVDDYVLLLGALVVSADVAFIETQFHLLGGAWPRYLLVLAVVHGLVAYVFDSRMVLSFSISALAAWIGVDRQSIERGTYDEIDFAGRAFTCAATLLMWRVLDERYRARTTFRRTLEHFAANVALWGGLALLVDDDMRAVGTLISVALAAFAVFWGVRTRSEPFVLYGFLYAVLAIAIFLVIEAGHEMASLLIFTSLVGAIAGVVAIHVSFRRAAR